VAVLVVATVAASLLRGSRTTDEPAPATPLPVGASNQGLVVADLGRSYRAYRPAELPAETALVLMLHGAGGSAAQAEASFGWTALAEREGFVVVHPEDVDRTWNTEGGCCGPAAARDVDEVAFPTRVVEDVSRRVTVDPDRVFVTGMSNGGEMSYTLACTGRRTPRCGWTASRGSASPRLTARRSTT
jgi:polyhydroxybutyrate depolymerase